MGILYKSSFRKAHKTNSDCGPPGISGGRLKWPRQPSSLTLVLSIVNQESRAISIYRDMACFFRYR
jgi:hypothetical protein